MTQLLLSLLEIAALVLVLAIYLTVIGPAVDRINGNLQDVCSNLQEAAVEAEKLAR